MRQRKRLLCNGCHKNNGVTTDGKVDCLAAGGAVEPVERLPQLRYEDCPERKVAALGRPVRPPHVLQEINRQAVLLKQRFQDNYDPSKIHALEERLVAELTQQ